MGSLADLQPRWRLRQRCASLGVPTALGGPLPDGRRVEVFVRGGVVIAERDATARWRGRALIGEQPAALADDERVAIHGLARRVIDDGRVELVRGAQGWALLQLDHAAPPGDAGGGVVIAATITAGEPAAAAQEVSGLVTSLHLPSGSDTTAQVGETLRAAHGEPIATVRVRGADRAEAVAALAQALESSRIDGVPTSLHLLRQVVASEPFIRGLAHARELDALAYAPPAIEVVAAGTHATVQDHPGRLGLWAVGVPPSGPMDDLAFRLANRLVGNADDCAGIESTLVGPTLRFHQPAIICLTGCATAATIDGAPMPTWRAVAVPAGALLRIGPPTDAGVHSCLAIRHGVDVPSYLGSRATFDLGGFGGHGGRALRAGDWLPLMRSAPASDLARCPPPLASAAIPIHVRDWMVGVLEGPHAAPDFFTVADMRALYATRWEVHHNSSRTGVRLIGPKPRWARADGGEAGLHPSNIHDNPYAIGAIDFTGDMPILLGPDGPSLGGFVCPAVVVAAERWKLGQLRPGDRLRFRRVTPAEAEDLQRRQERLIADAGAPAGIPGSAGRQLGPAKPSRGTRADPGHAVIHRLAPSAGRPALCFRRSGDRYLLIEYGDAVLDIALRLRVHLLLQALERERLPGVIDLTPGIRSLQVHHDPARLPQARLVELIVELDAALPDPDGVEVPMRTVHLPLSWDDPATRLAIARYMRGVRADAPWCPSNIEFIHRINGLGTIDEVKRIVFAADYLVLGLGDVYLGAPVATPLDPRHRLVTTKYNPARTWTPENAVGIGGAYLCVYGMESPGGYQFVGRTVPVWNAWRRTADFPRPWLLRAFDTIRFTEVGAEELLRLREDVPRGRHRLRIEPASFRLGDHRRFLADHADGIAAFRATQRAAFAAERARWDAQKLEMERGTGQAPRA